MYKRQLEIDGRDVDIKVEYDKDRYKTLSQVQNIVLQTPTGGAVALTDVADLVFEDSPSTIRRQDKPVSYTHLDVYKRQPYARQECSEIEPELKPAFAGSGHLVACPVLAGEENEKGGGPTYG